MRMTETAPAAPTTTFHVRAERGDQYWVLHVASPVDRWTQARHLREVDAMARDLIAIMLDVPADSFALDVDVIMPAPVTARLAEAGKFTEQANHARPAGVSLSSWAQAPRRK